MLEDIYNISLSTWLDKLKAKLLIVEHHVSREEVVIAIAGLQQLSVLMLKAIQNKQSCLSKQLIDVPLIECKSSAIDSDHQFNT